MGDLEQDPVMKELVSLPSQNPQRFTKANIEQEENVLCRALQVLLGFFDTANPSTHPSQANGKDACACDANSQSGNKQQRPRQMKQSHLQSVVLLAPCIRVDKFVVTQGQ